MTQIAVEGLRGIGQRAELGMSPGPGLTLVVGRNGTGKSSFAEAAELVLTGSCSRWSGRKKVWEDGWANLHHKGPRTAEVRLAVEGQPGQTLLAKKWKPNAALKEAEAFAQQPGGKQESIDVLGFDSALTIWRPFLSYSELGSLLEEGPSRLYDAISRILGLDEWVDGEQRLNQVRKAMEDDAKEARAEGGRIRQQLNELEDDRAEAVLAALPIRKSPDLDTIRALVAGEVIPADTAALDALASMSPGDEDVVASRVEILRLAIADVEAVASTDAGRARELAQLLERAVKVHTHLEDAHCPVCDRKDALDEAWEAATKARIHDLKEVAKRADASARALAAASQEARSLIAAPPAVLGRGAPGVETGPLAEVWAEWRRIPDDPSELADHLEKKFAPLAQEAGALRTAASEEAKRRKDAWLPIAARIQSWVPAAEKARSEASLIQLLKNSATWLAAETTTVRNERFAPIAKEVHSVWEILRQNSSVSLDRVTLEGTHTRRRVELSVSVDDIAGQAIAVMSQGELHALALSLFLPRATLKESPFRFIVIDDPVQSMDAARVEGLAQLLGSAAITHQVIVFTHDERLREAARRLGLPARVLEVSRGRRSKLSIRLLHHPVADYLDDARAVVKSTELPQEARRRVIPGLCRNALEAACDETAMKRMLGKGVGHAEAMATLADSRTVLERMAAGLWGDPGKAGDVLSHVNRTWGRQAGDCVQALKAGAHKLIDDDPLALISATDRLANAILQLQ